MTKVIGNFLNPGGGNRDFPLDCETLDNLQALTALAAVIGNIAGDKAVLSGCQQYSIKGAEFRHPGYVFVRTDEYPDGEVLPWEGGPTTGGMYVKQEAVPVLANDTDYPQAYTRRSLSPGIGNGRPFDWSEFTEIATIPELMAENRKFREQLAQTATAGVLAGVIQMWAGQAVPEGYLPCDGRELPETEYPELFAAIGTTFNEAWCAAGYEYETREGYFRIPDLRGRFIVGKKESDADYEQSGNVGGAKSVSLQIDQLPRHSHQEQLPYKNVYLSAGAEGVVIPSATTGDKAIDTYTLDAGGGSVHENRPPYYVLAYIIRVK